MSIRVSVPTDRAALLERIAASPQGTARLCNNTTAERQYSEPNIFPEFDGVVVRYHGHAIVILHPDNSTTLADCGWRTSTTKERLNLFAPYGVRVWQEKGVWYYSVRDNDVPKVWRGAARFTAWGQERTGKETSA
jgi:hypothetical protein